MIILMEQDYYKALELLNRVTINTLFAEAVLRQVVPGTVYVDCDQHPQAFYVAHPYGMSLVYGRSDKEEFNRDLYDYITNKERTRPGPEWLQADPAGDWPDILEQMHTIHNRTVDGSGESGLTKSQPLLIRNTRVNFRFNREVYLQNKRQFSLEHEIVRMSRGMYASQSGSVTAENFWRDEEQFLAEGLGFSLLDGGSVAATAFSAFATEEQLEIGIETGEEYRGRGYAYAVCSALIDYCLEHRLEPVWSCRLENTGSYHLASKLGFETSLTLPYYRLPE